MNRPQERFFTLSWVIILNMLIGGCAFSGPNIQATQLPLQETLVLTDDAIPTTPLSTRPPISTTIPTPIEPDTIPTKTLEQSAVTTPSPIEFYATILRRSTSDSDGRVIVTAFWSHENEIIYGLDDADYTTLPNEPEWYAIDLKLLQEQKLVSPPMIFYTPNIAPLDFYHRFTGFVSPSGKYELEIRGNSDERIDPASSHKISGLWLIDRSGITADRILVEGADLHYRTAQWYLDESKVVFSVGPEFGTDIYLLDINKGIVTPISELTGFDDPGLLEWTLSPDGKKLAIVDGQGSLQILSLEGEPDINLSGFYQNVRWTLDNKAIYFYHGHNWYDPDMLARYELTSKETTKIAAIPVLEQSGIYGLFDVSSTGEQVLVWSSNEIWLLALSLDEPHFLQVDGVFKVTDSGNNLNLRLDPSINAKIVRKLQSGDIVTVLDGSVEADGYTWWKIQREDGLEGWAINFPGWFEKVK